MEIAGEEKSGSSVTTSLAARVARVKARRASLISKCCDAGERKKRRTLFALHASDGKVAVHAAELPFKKASYIQPENRTRLQISERRGRRRSDFHNGKAHNIASTHLIFTRKKRAET